MTKTWTLRTCANCGYALSIENGGGVGPPPVVVSCDMCGHQGEYKPLEVMPMPDPNEVLEGAAKALWDINREIEGRVPWSEAADFNQEHYLENALIVLQGASRAWRDQKSQ